MERTPTALGVPNNSLNEDTVALIIYHYSCSVQYDPENAKDYDLFRFTCVCKIWRSSFRRFALDYYFAQRVHSDRYIRHFADCLTDATLGKDSLVTDVGLSLCTNLTRLSLNANQLITNSALSAMDKISHLSLACNTRITLLALDRFSSCLTSLDIAENRIVSDGYLTQLTGLTHLDLSRNTKVTSASLKHLTNLTSLSINREELFVFRPSFWNWNAKNCQRREETCVMFNQNARISDEAIIPLANLTSLDLAYHMKHCAAGWKLSGNGLKSLTNLTYLNLKLNEVVGDDGLKNMINLTSLNLHGNTTITEHGLSGLSKLTILDLSAASVAVHKLFTPMVKSLCLNSFLTGLTSLSLCANQVIGDSGLEYLTNLTSLDISGISDASPRISDVYLRKCTQLLSLNLSGNRLITDEGLSGLTLLTTLHLRCVASYYSDPIVTDRGLSCLWNLTHLNIVSNQRITENGFSHLTALKILDAKGWKNLPSDFAERMKLRNNFTLDLENYKYDM